MTSAEKRRLRRQYDQAECDEVDWGRNLADTKRELAVTNPNYSPRRVEMLREHLALCRKELLAAQDRVDSLRRQVRAAGLPPAEPEHPGGGAAAIVERDKHAKPTQWNQGGDISDIHREWDAPVEPKRDRR